MSRKTKDTKKLIAIAAEILTAIGFPIQELTPRRGERVAMALLATANIGSMSKINQPKTIDDGIVMKTRDIINFMNSHFGENISSGSYDDIRRKDLKQLILGSIVMRTNENLARNDSTRGYALNHSAAPLFQSYGTENWKQEVDKFVKMHGSVTDLLDRTRDIVRIPITIKVKLWSSQTANTTSYKKLSLRSFCPFMDTALKCYMLAIRQINIYISHRKNLTGLAFLS
jgi:type II restriction enzyme